MDWLNQNASWLVWAVNLAILAAGWALSRTFARLEMVRALERRLDDTPHLADLHALALSLEGLKGETRRLEHELNLLIEHHLRGDPS